MPSNRHPSGLDKCAFCRYKATVAEDILSSLLANSSIYTQRSPLVGHENPLLSVPHSQVMSTLLTATSVEIA
jgi:hypothetical protein